MKIKARDDAKRVPNHDGIGFQDTETRLFDLRRDPGEQWPFGDAAVEEWLLSAAARLMRAHDAPPEMFARFAIEPETALRGDENRHGENGNARALERGSSS